MTAPAPPPTGAGASAPPPGADAPTAPDPVGAALCVVGVALVALSMTMEHITVDDGDEAVGLAASFFGNLFGGASGGTATLVPVAVVVAVGVAANRRPQVHWPARMVAIGLAVVAMGATYQPVTELRTLVEASGDSLSGGGFVPVGEDPPPADVPEVSAGIGVWVAMAGYGVLAAAAWLIAPRSAAWRPARPTTEMWSPPTGAPPVPGGPAGTGWPDGPPLRPGPPEGPTGPGPSTAPVPPTAGTAPPGTPWPDPGPPRSDGPPPARPDAL